MTPYRRPCLLLRPRILYALAIAILVLCAAHRPWRLLFIFSGKGLTRAVVLVIVGFVIAALIHLFGQACLRTRSGPWYTRWTAVLYLPVALIGINAVLPVVDRIASALTGAGPFLASAAAANALIAIELIGIALLE
jgi:hypothetical protein